ncbi:hypothetical protein MP228_008377 [Amoeboaphelidium protococcarum]|nr:hypothetical protein MP228_008377 [Amoeboaphelidium protococcarum]
MEGDSSRFPSKTSTLLANKRFLQRNSPSRAISSRSSSLSKENQHSSSAGTQSLAQEVLSRKRSKDLQNAAKLSDSGKDQTTPATPRSRLSKYGAGNQKQPNQVYIHTTPRRASIVRKSMADGVLPAYLLYSTENGAEQRFDLTRESYTVGRRDDRDIVLQCQQISKYHCTLDKTQDGWLITDNNSANHVYINDVRINEPTILRQDDEILLGSVRLTFHAQVDVNPRNWRKSIQSHPAFVGQVSEDEEEQDTDGDNLLDPHALPINSPTQSAGNVLSDYADRLSKISVQSRSSAGGSAKERPLSDIKNINLVTILPSERKYEETLTVRTELTSDPSGQDFRKADEITDIDTLKNDYEKLRLAYELSKLSLNDLDINEILERTLDIMFSVLPVDRGVVMLVDRKTSILTIDKVKLRNIKGIDKKEILLSNTVLKKVVNTKTCVITSDAFQDPLLGQAESIARGMIRSVICVPLIAHDQVHGILHLDSQNKINAFAEKDLQLVKSIANQAAIALENCKLIKDIEKEVTIRENLGRFLPPHVIDKVISTGEEPVKKGGRHTKGTILFADIRGFTRLSEDRSPQEIVDLLNDFFERLVKIVFKYDGVLDKYIGDCLMAAFGTLNEEPDERDVRNAVCAAMEFKVAISEMNMDRVNNGKEPISIGVGLNTGGLIAGYIGSSQRLEYTSIGDTVNTASRICSMASSNQVLISQNTYNEVSKYVDARFVDKKLFKGKTEEVAVYEVVNINEGYPQSVLRKLSE